MSCLYNKKAYHIDILLSMAERVGFEPTVPVKARQFSRLFHSTTLASLLKKYKVNYLN